MTRCFLYEAQRTQTEESHPSPRYVWHPLLKTRQSQAQRRCTVMERTEMQAEIKCYPGPPICAACFPNGVPVKLKLLFFKGVIHYCCCGIMNNPEMLRSFYLLFTEALYRQNCQAPTLWEKHRTNNT